MLNISDSSDKYTIEDIKYIFEQHFGNSIWFKKCYTALIMAKIQASSQLEKLVQYALALKFLLHNVMK